MRGRRKNPPRNGEGDQRSWWRGPEAPAFIASGPLHHRFAAVPLPVPGRILPFLLLAACSGSAPQPGASPTPPSLESAAIARGLVRDPKASDVTGLYARDTDRLCVVPDGTAYRVGAFVDYGDKISCTGRGTAARSGATLAIEFKGRNGETCSFDAKFDGDRITFPANVPDACAKLCGPRASFAALEVERLSESAAEAEALRSAEGVRLCGS